MTETSDARKRREENEKLPCDSFFHVLPAIVRQEDEINFCPKCGVEL